MAALRSYGYLGRDRQRNRQFFSGMPRGVSNSREGSKILRFLFRSSLVCCSLLDLRSSWKAYSANYFALCAFSDVHHKLAENTAFERCVALLRGVRCDCY
jgi:hypothetical protein